MPSTPGDWSAFHIDVESGLSRTVITVRLKADTTYNGPPEGGHYVQRSA